MVLIVFVVANVINVDSDEVPDVADAIIAGVI